MASAVLWLIASGGFHQNAEPVRLLGLGADGGGKLAHTDITVFQSQVADREPSSNERR
jgi:hypothetical protein